MANVAVSKFLDGLPFYRQEQIWKRVDIDLPRATLARWSIEAGNLVQALINMLREHQWAGEVMHIDEAPVQVLKEPDKPPEGNKYFWGTASGHPTNRFTFSTTTFHVAARWRMGCWKASVARSSRMTGWLYARVCEKRQLTHIACMIMRGASLTKPESRAEKQKRQDEQSRYSDNYYQKLYAIERKIQEITRRAPAHSSEGKCAGMGPVYGMHGKTHPQNHTGIKIWQALNYAYKLRDKLRFYSETGHMPMSNQVAENAIRPFAIARKNFLFYDTPKGASASANLYSLIMTAKSHGLDPFIIWRMCSNTCRAQKPLRTLKSYCLGA